MKNIIIFGAPGSGKGTYSDEIASRYGMGHISTGDVLRAEIKNGTELGKIAQGYINNGQLIPDDLMIEILAKTCTENFCCPTFALSFFHTNENAGCPAQAEAELPQRWLRSEKCGKSSSGGNKER